MPFEYTQGPADVIDSRPERRGRLGGIAVPSRIAPCAEETTVPRYAYECFECGHTLEKLEGWDAPAKQPCSECDSELQRIPSAPAIVFKGSGWYSTDNRKSSWKSRSDEDRDGGSGDSESGGEGSEAKAEGGKEAVASAAE